MRLRTTLTAGALGLAAVLAAAGPAGAHAVPSESEAPAGSYLKFDMRIGHGCGEEGNTTKVEIQIPEGIYSATAQVVPGWTISKTAQALDEPVDDGHGGQYTERDAVVTWEGGPLMHDQLEEFGLSVKLPDTPGETLYFPTIQTCDNGETNDWVQIAEEGEEEPESPAPAIALTEAAGDGHGGGGEEEMTDDTAAGENVDTEAASSTSDGDDDGTDGMAVAGLVAGLAGLGLGGTAFARTRKSA